MNKFVFPFPGGGVNNFRASVVIMEGGKAVLALRLFSKFFTEFFMYYGGTEIIRDSI